MPKRKYNEMYIEEKKQARKRNISEIQPYINQQIKKIRSYPQFNILAAHYKGYLTRIEFARELYLFYYL